MKNLALLLLLTSSICFASGGDRVGNGGDVVICSEDHGNTIFVLEEYESKTPILERSPAMAYQNKVEYYLMKFFDHSPARYDYYKKNFQTFESKVKFLSTKLPEINDSNETTGEYCYTRQAAFFNRNNQGELQFYIQKNIWNKLNEGQKAILVMHELIYVEAVGLGHTESTFVRMANRSLYAGQNANMNLFDEYLLRPSQWVTGNNQTIRERLQNSYSDKIVQFFLERALKSSNKDKTLYPVLMGLKMRFHHSSETLDLIEELLAKLPQDV